MYNIKICLIEVLHFCQKQFFYSLPYFLFSQVHSQMWSPQISSSPTPQTGMCVSRWRQQHRADTACGQTAELLMPAPQSTSQVMIKEMGVSMSQETVFLFVHKKTRYSRPVSLYFLIPSAQSLLVGLIPICALWGRKVQASVSTLTVLPFAAKGSFYNFPYLVSTADSFPGCCHQQ